MRNRIAFVFISLSIAVSAVAQTGGGKVSNDSEKRSAHESLLLVAGMQTTLDLKFDPCANTAECIRIGNKQLFEVQYSADKHQLIFTPVKQGETTVVVRDTKGDIQLVIDALVTSVNLKRLLVEATEVFKNSKSVTVKITADHLTLDGEITSLELLRRVRRLASDISFKNVWLELAHPSGDLMKQVAAAVQKQLGGANKVAPFGDNLVLSGAGSEKYATQAEELALALGLKPLPGTRLIISREKKP